MHLDFPLELITRGNPQMLETVIWSLASEMPLVGIRTDSHAPSTSFFKRVVLLGASGVPVGTLQLQALPDDRTLVRLAVPLEGPSEQFSSFCESLLNELARLGFIEIPDVPKDPLGFRKG